VFGTERLTLRRASAAGYEAVVAMDPGHDWALMCLSGLYPELGRPGDALAVAERLATLHPHSLTAMWRVALAADRLGNTAMARRYADRGNRLDGAIDERNAYQAAWLRLFPARQAWLEGDVVAASRVVAQAMREMEGLTPAAQEGFALELVPHLLALGQLARAEVAAARLPPAARGFYMSRIVTPTLGHGTTAAERQAGRAVITRFFPDVRQATNIISAYVLVGDLDRARQAMDLLEAGPGGPPDYLRLSRAHLAMADGHVERVVELLEPHHADGPPRGSRMWAVTALTLANAHAARGDHARAVRLLEDATRRRADYDAASAHAWLPLRHRLAELYRVDDRSVAADAVEAELRGLLAVADDDHPIRRRLAAPAPITP
jgi:prepilin-type processing-associated H-X9-DG protein